MSFTQETIDAVWNKAHSRNMKAESGEFKQDDCGAWINKNAYGNRSDDFGWEIDHITPKSEGGSDELSNLRPLHWENNASRQNGILNTTNPTIRAATNNLIENERPRCRGVLVTE